MSSLAVAAPGPRGTLAVTIASSSDASPGVLDAHARKRHGEIVRRALQDVLRRSGLDVRHAGIGPKQIDVSVVSWRVTPSARDIAVATVVRLVVCDEHGKMLTIVTGRASVTAPRVSPIDELRAQAIDSAIGGMVGTLQSQLARAAS